MPEPTTPAPDELREEPEELHEGPPVIPVPDADGIVPGFVSLQQARALQEANPEASVLMLPDPSAMTTEDPALLLGLLREMGVSVVQAFEDAVFFDLARNEQTPPPPGTQRYSNVVRVATLLEDALVEVYSEDPRMLARAYVQHFMDDTLEGVTAMLQAQAKAKTEETTTAEQDERDRAARMDDRG